MEPNNHRSGSSQGRGPANSTFDPQFRIERIREQILTYLADSPRKLRQLGAESAGEVALSLGNCLAWISGHMEAASSHRYQGPEQTPVTVYALGTQLQEIGRELIERPKATGNVQDRLERLEKLLQSNLTLRTAQAEMPTGAPGRDEVFEARRAA